MFEWCQMKRFKQASETQSAVELRYLNVQSNMLSEKNTSYNCDDTVLGKLDFIQLNLNKIIHYIFVISESEE